MIPRSYRRRSIVLVVAAGTLSPPSVLSAQGRGAGQGPSQWWWSASAAVQGSRLTCDFCDPDRDFGPSLGFGAGAYASPRLRVGVDGSWATSTEEGTRESIYAAGFVAELHPNQGSGLHLVGGLGWAGYRAGDFSYDAVRLRLGAGWDLPLAGPWVVGNRLTWDASAFASLHNDGAPVVRDVGLGTMTFGLYVGRR